MPSDLQYAFYFQLILKSTAKTKLEIILSLGHQGNDCIFKTQFGIAVIYNLYILPKTNNIVHEYINSTVGDYHEEKKLDSNDTNYRTLTLLLRFVFVCVKVYLTKRHFLVTYIAVSGEQTCIHFVQCNTSGDKREREYCRKS